MIFKDDLECDYNGSDGKFFTGCGIHERSLFFVSVSTSRTPRVSTVIMENTVVI